MEGGRKEGRKVGWFYLTSQFSSAKFSWSSGHKKISLGVFCGFLQLGSKPGDRGGKQ